MCCALRIETGRAQRDGMEFGLSFRRQRQRLISVGARVQSPPCRRCIWRDNVVYMRVPRVHVVHVMSISFRRCFSLKLRTRSEPGSPSAGTTLLYTHTHTLSQHRASPFRVYSLLRSPARPQLRLFIGAVAATNIFMRMLYALRARSLAVSHTLRVVMMYSYVARVCCVFLLC